MKYKWEEGWVQSEACDYSAVNHIWFIWSRSNDSDLKIIFYTYKQLKYDIKIYTVWFWSDGPYMLNACSQTALNPRLYKWGWEKKFPHLHSIPGKVGPRVCSNKPLLILLIYLLSPPYIATNFMPLPRFWCLTKITHEFHSNLYDFFTLNSCLILGITVPWTYLSWPFLLQIVVDFLFWTKLLLTFNSRKKYLLTSY